MAAHPMTVNAFVASEVELYEAEGHNRLVAAGAGAIRCEQYLDEIERRYSAAADAHARTWQEFLSSLKPGHQAMDAEQMRMYAALSHQGMLVHLEIESFYLFSKILLDRTAQLMHWWFADTRMARGISIQRHSQLVDNLSQLIVAGQLVVPEGMLDLARALQTQISDYRDYEVVHDSKHAFPATLWTAEGQAKIVKVRLGGAKGAINAGESEHLAELNDARRRYVGLAMQLLILNRDRGKLAALRKPG